MRAWLLLAGCVLLWQSERQVSELSEARRIEEQIRAEVCEQRGERFLEIRRVQVFVGFPGQTLDDKLELRLPRGDDPTIPRGGGVPNVPPR